MRTRRKQRQQLSHKKGEEAQRIPLRLIRPDPDQPRKNFNLEELKSLAASILAVGQRTPVSVSPIYDVGGYQYKLTDGERRYQACQMAGLETIRAFVEEVASDDERFVRSVAMNFCRVGHTPLETAHAIERMLKYYLAQGKQENDAIDIVMRICGKSITWVRQNFWLLKLQPEIQELVEEGKLPFQVGVALTNRTPEFQVTMAKHIVAHDMNYHRALSYIRAHQDESTIVPGGRRRKPSADYKILSRFIRQLERDSESILGMPFKKFEDMFRVRSVDELNRIIRNIGDRVEDLQQLQQIFTEIRDKKRGALHVVPLATATVSG